METIHPAFEKTDKLITKASELFGRVIAFENNDSSQSFASFVKTGFALARAPGLRRKIKNTILHHGNYSTKIKNFDQFAIALIGLNRKGDQTELNKALMDGQPFQTNMAISSAILTNPDSSYYAPNLLKYAAESYCKIAAHTTGNVTLAPLVKSIAIAQKQSKNKMTPLEEIGLYSDARSALVKYAQNASNEKIIKDLTQDSDQPTSIHFTLTSLPLDEDPILKNAVLMIALKSMYNNGFVSILNQPQHFSFNATYSMYEIIMRHGKEVDDVANATDTSMANMAIAMYSSDDLSEIEKSRELKYIESLPATYSFGIHQTEGNVTTKTASILRSLLALNQPNLNTDQFVQASKQLGESCDLSNLSEHTQKQVRSGLKSSLRPKDQKHLNQANL